MRDDEIRILRLNGRPACEATVAEIEAAKAKLRAKIALAEAYERLRNADV